MVVRGAFDAAEPHGQHRLGALQGLDLALFGRAPQHGMIRRVQVQPDDRTGLHDKEGVGGELEVQLAVIRVLCMK